LEWFVVDQPGVLTVDFLGLSPQVVQHVHLRFHLGVHAGPVLSHIFVVCAQSDDHPDGQIFQLLESRADISIARNSVCGNDDCALFSSGAQAWGYELYLGGYLGEVLDQRSTTAWALIQEVYEHSHIVSIVFLSPYQYRICHI
jgi:hypothetical protein